MRNEKTRKFGVASMISEACLNHNRETAEKAEEWEWRQMRIKMGIMIVEAIEDGGQHEIVIQKFRELRIGPDDFPRRLDMQLRAEVTPSGQ